VILDSSVLIGAERGSVHFESFVGSPGDEAVGIAAITASELLHGCLRATSPGVRTRRAAWVEGVLAVVPIWPFGILEARRHAELWSELARQGIPVGAHDLLIAATAVARGDRIATLNRTEFLRIPGVQLVTP
jgi:predicted nucleic acid-binding protein